MKTCSKCHQELLTTEFRKDKSKHDGYYPSCNDCHRKKYGVTKGGTRLPGKWHIGTDGYVHKGDFRQHRWMMERHLGRKLETWEHVHHLNGVKHDNRIENLEVVEASEHHHIHTGKIPKGKNMVCTSCGKAKYYAPCHLKVLSEVAYRCIDCYVSVKYSRGEDNKYVLGIH